MWPFLSQICLENPASLAAFQFVDGLLLNLTHALAREVQFVADFLQRLLWHVDTEELAEDIRLTGRQRS